MPSNSTMRVRSRSRCSSRAWRPAQSGRLRWLPPCALQVALHGGHVVHRLGHHAGQFLHAGEAVELQRVETRRQSPWPAPGATASATRPAARCRAAASATDPGCRSGRQRAPQLPQLGFQARTGDHHLAGLVDQTVQQLRSARAPPGWRRHATAPARSPAGPRMCTARARVGGGHRHNRSGGFGFDKLLLCTARRRDAPRGTQRYRSSRLHVVKAVQQRLEVGRQNAPSGQSCSISDSMRCAISPRRKAPASRALPLSVCSTQHFARGHRGCPDVLRPLAQCTTQLRHQLQSLFLENREQVRINGVGDVDRHLRPSSERRCVAGCSAPCSASWERDHCRWAAGVKTGSRRRQTEAAAGTPSDDGRRQRACQ
jgi:hypothetical protein